MRTGARAASRELAWVLALASVLGAAPVAHAADGEGGRIVGSLVFRERDRALSPAEAQRLVGGRRIGIAFRNGREVTAARLEGDGRFSADVAPGTWRLEWIDVGDRAEMLGTHLQVDVVRGGPTCAGRIELTYSDLGSELGASAAGRVTVAGGCDSGKAAAVPAADGYVPAFGFAEVAEGLRLEGRFTDQVPGLRVAMAVPLRVPIAWMGNLVAVGAASRLFESGGAIDAVEVGGGFVPYWGAELTGGVRWTSGGRGAGGWAALRLGPAPYGFNVRVDLRDGATWTFGLDVSAFHLVGRFL